MMRLFREEHRKLWKRASVKISVLFCFTYIIVFGGLLSYQWIQFGTSGDFTSSFGNRFDGYKSIRSRMDHASQWEGELTDAKIQKMVKDYQDLRVSDPDRARDETDWRVLNSWIQTLWPELEEPEKADIMLSYVEPDKLTGFYERREQQIEKFLDLIGTSDDEKTFFLRMDGKVEIPFQYSWVEGWSNLLGNVLTDMGVVTGLFIGIALAPIFAGERQREMRFLILTAKYGGIETAAAKTAAGFAFSAELFGMMTAGTLLLQYVYLGTSGWDLPIQCIKLIATAPWNMMQAEIYEYLFAFLGCLGYAGVVMLISVLCRSSFAAILSALAVICVPGAVGEYLPAALQKIVDLIPLAGSSTDIFRTNVYHIFGRIIWSPWILITVPFVAGAACVPLCVRKWRKQSR